MYYNRRTSPSAIGTFSISKMEWSAKTKKKLSTVGIRGTMSDEHPMWEICYAVIAAGLQSQVPCVTFTENQDLTLSRAASQGAEAHL